MKTGIRFFLALAGCVVLLAGCDAALSSGGVTVSGTVGGSFINATGNATVTVSSGSSSFTTSIPIPVIDPQTVQYSLAHVPAGNYKITVTFSAYASNLNASYAINGGQQLVPDIFGSTTLNQQQWDFTLIVNSISVQTDEKIDAIISPSVQ